jgi:4-amino-4-deoxychorismate lyase
MYRLIESIRVENQQLQHIDYHNRRFNEAAKEMFGASASFRLEDVVLLPANLNNSRYKLRIAFDGESFEQELSPYDQKSIGYLKMVEVNHIDYHLKTENREAISQALAQRGTCDDILIVKNNCITDASFANVIFFDGTTWYTPDTPLLKGTQRQYLLDIGKIREMHIYANSIHQFSEFKLINAMIDFERAISLPINRVISL